MGEHRPRVYVIAHDHAEAAAWARRNKPEALFKYGSTSSKGQALGLHIKDEPVYVLNDMTAEVRSAWLVTGCRLVYV